MTRLFRIIVHNWPLKLAAVGLATLLYGGLVVSQSTTTFEGAAIPVTVENQPDDTYLLNTIEPVTEVRYFSPSGRRPVASTFKATVDLSNVPAGTGPVLVPVQVVSLDPTEIQVIGYTPDRVTIDLDTVAEKQVPVRVEQTPPPAGLTTGDTVVEPSTVTVSGPTSKVETVVAVRADVIIQPSGISIDQDVPVVPIDANGQQVSPIELDPDVVNVTIPVFQDVRNRSLPVKPVVTGTPAPGFEIAAVTVEPSVVTVAGDAEELGSLTSIETQPVSVNGASETVEDDPALVMPDGVVPVEASTVQVTVTLRPVTATRSFDAGLDLVGEVPGTDYGLSVDRVLLTLGGSTADLDRLSGATIVGQLDVTGLPAGSTDVPVTVDLPPGVTLVTASPPSVTVTVSARPSASPAASGGAIPSPAG